MGFRGSRVQIPPSRFIASAATTYGDSGRRLSFRGSPELIPQLPCGSCACLAITYPVSAAEILHQPRRCLVYVVYELVYESSQTLWLQMRESNRFAIHART